MEELLATLALVTVMMSAFGWIDVKRLTRADEDVVYRKVGNKWVKVEL